MLKATITLPNGTTVTIEGQPEEVQELMRVYGARSTELSKPKVKRRRNAGSKARKSAGAAQAEPGIDLSKIVNATRDSDDAEAIETTILDKTSQVDRTLLPIYILQQHIKDSSGLTSGEISKVLKDLGIPISIYNVSGTLSGSAARYVMPDKMKRPGQAVRYTLNRRGLQYIKSVLDGSAGSE